MEQSRTIQKSTPSQLSEVMLLGGLSILAWLAAWIFIDPKGSVYRVSQIAFFLAFVINFPHFFSSYLLLYNDFKKSAFTKPRYIWASLIAPTLLLNYLGFTLYTGRADFLAVAIRTMFFLVGWHYVKQVFGCMIVSCARRDVFFSKWERRLLLVNLFTVWASSFLRSQVTDKPSNYYGVKYFSFNLPAWTLTFANAMIAVTILVLVVALVRKFVLTGARLSMGATAALTSLYVWHFPFISHSSFGYFIPMFHSLQYLALVHLFKKNQTLSKAPDLKTKENRLIWLKSFIGFFALATILGSGIFHFAPVGLDRLIPLASELGSQPFVIAALLFMNIHHYIIDSVIWRSDNDEIRAHLFGIPNQNTSEEPKHLRSAA